MVLVSYRAANAVFRRCGRPPRCSRPAYFFRRPHYIEAMPTLIAGVVAIIVLYSLLQMFRAANPAVLARAVKIGGGILALAVAAFTGFRGELAVAVPLGIFGAGLLGWSPFGTPSFGSFGGIFGAGGQRSAKQASRVRSRFFEMTLDHDTGALTGMIVSGANAGHSLEEFDLPVLLGMFPELDAESVPLLESYLDRRFPAWRQNAQGDSAGRQRSAASSGKMTDEEAYQILGLKPGAGRDEIGRAHRALMKKLHPDQGGSTYLAARVNEAKEVLLRTHHN
jgi:hypothetical protein